MPEMRFDVQWPDGSTESCYSPSSIITHYFNLGEVYTVSDFVSLSEQALTQASNRVRAKYGFACSSALDQLQRIKSRAEEFQSLPNPEVIVKKIE